MEDRIFPETPGPLDWNDCVISPELRVLVMAPHPDDFEVIAVTLKHLVHNGNRVYCAVATSGASGVQDGYCEPDDWETRSATREREQRDSFMHFGLKPDRYSFLRLLEDEEGHPSDSGDNTDILRQVLHEQWPDLVFLPHPHDTNPGHQRIHAMTKRIAGALGYPVTACLVRDPKTVEMRTDLYLPYGEQQDAWKSRLLRFHQTQHQRNLETRGHGLDDRIREINRAIAGELGLDAPFAEGFEITIWPDGLPAGTESTKRNAS